MAKILRYNYKTQDEALDSRLDELEAKVVLHEGQETVAADIDNRVGSAVAALTNNEKTGSIDQAIANLQNQIDDAINTWFYAGVPTLANEPASEWATDDAKNVHLGDLYYDTETGYCYRFMVVDGTYSWGLVKDTEIATALRNAAAAQATADSKAKTFYGADVPTLENAPASGWEAEDYEKHVGDLYFTADGATYRFDGEKWVGVGHDGVTTYTGEGEPVLGTNPAWDEADYPNHDKDIYFDVTTGARYSFAYDETEGTGEWVLIGDSAKVDVDQGVANAGHHLFVNDAGHVSSGIAKELYLQDATGAHTFTISIDAEGGLMVSEITE